MPANKATTQPDTTKQVAAQKTAAVKKASEPSTDKTTKSTAAAKSTASATETIVISDPAPAAKTKKPAKATATRSTTPKKPVKKPAAPKTSTTQKASGGRKKTATTGETRVIAKVDVGFGNSLFIRGEGAELSWEKGILMENISSDEWHWSTKTAGDLVVKFLINDEIWCQGDDLTLASGTTSASTPAF
jgi:hypothetical protein